MQNARIRAIAQILAIFLAVQLHSESTMRPWGARDRIVVSPGSTVILENRVYADICPDPRRSLEEGPYISAGAVFEYLPQGDRDGFGFLLWWWWRRGIVGQLSGEAFAFSVLQRGILAVAFAAAFRTDYHVYRPVARGPIILSVGIVLVALD